MPYANSDTYITDWVGVSNSTQYRLEYGSWDDNYDMRAENNVWCEDVWDNPTDCQKCIYGLLKEVDRDKFMCYRIGVRFTAMEEV